MKQTYLTPKLREGETVDLSQYHPRQRTNIRLYGLDNIDWTPQDVFTYKTSWIPNGERVTTFKFDEGVHWCKANLFMHQWHVNKYANPDDSHEFLFEKSEEAMLFKLSNA